MRETQRETKMETRKKRSERLNEHQQHAIEEKESAAEPRAAEQRALREEQGDALTIRFICTLSAMLSLLALFLVFAEKERKDIRRFSVQSVALTAAHLGCGLLILLVGLALRPIPILGFVMALACWLTYLAVLAATLIARVRMMLCAWRGEPYELPLLGARLRRMI